MLLSRRWEFIQEFAIYAVRIDSFLICPDEARAGIFYEKSVTARAASRWMVFGGVGMGVLADRTPCLPRLRVSPDPHQSTDSGGAATILRTDAHRRPPVDTELAQAIAVLAREFWWLTIPEVCPPGEGTVVEN